MSPASRLDTHNRKRGLEEKRGRGEEKERDKREKEEESKFREFLPYPTLLCHRTPNPSELDLKLRCAETVLRWVPTREASVTQIAIFLLRRAGA